MAKLFYYLFIPIFICLCLGSCQKENTDLPADLQLPAINGKWYLKTLVTKTSADTSLNSKTSTDSSFTTNDFFEFKSNNVSTYSSTSLGKIYNGYYSANTTVLPQTLTFKSGDYLNKFFIYEASKDNLILYQTSATKSGTVTTTVTETYTYKK